MAQVPSSSSVSKMGSLPLPAGNYEVFLSFRGPDVRNGFAGTLYKFLSNNGIHTFYDDEELCKGEEMDIKLIESIEESKIYIPIFSPDYASSKWCLLELAHMMKYCYKRKGHLILPIFYMVEPRDVRHQEGPFKSFFVHLFKKYDPETIIEWKEALQMVGKLKGWHVTASNSQGDIIDEVSAKVWSHLMADYKLVTSELVGMDSHVEQVKGRLNKDVKIVGIYGMSGIGKTTIARAVCDSVRDQFDRFCFVEDVRDILSKSDGIVTLQNKILSSILRKDIKVTDASQGIRTIKDRVCCWSTLIVLDDVGERFQFDKTLGDLMDFPSKSRFIITTMDERVMQFFQQNELYQPGEMSYDDALQLFSRYAFGMDYPPRDYMALSKEFVIVAAGLPLVLEVIGSLLFHKDISFWEAKLVELKDIPPGKVHEKLKICYMELTREQKQIFLDIACFFVGEHYDRPFYLWSDLKLHPKTVIDTLRLKSWVKINKRNEFWMHDHYKNLATAIVHEENLSLNPWERSRIWSNNNVLDMLRVKEGTPRLHILRVDMRGEDFELTDQEFKKLSGLKYLEVRNGRLTGDFKEILPDLRWLRLDNCSSIPVDFNSKKLVILDLGRCSVRDDWRGWNEIKVAPKLKVVDLWSCEYLRTAPDLSQWQCGTLECLNLEGCQEMRGELFVGNFGHLKVLKLGSTQITKLTGDIGMLQNIQEIEAGDSHLIEVPAGIGKLSALEFLDLRSKELQSKVIPTLPESLKRLYLSSPRVPNLLELQDLENLWFSNCDATEIPGDVWKLSKLKTLKLSNCSCKRLLGRTRNGAPPYLPASLNSLEIEGCRHLKTLPNLENLDNLTKLVLTEVGVCKLVGLINLRMLDTLRISDAPNLTNLDGLEHLVLLKTLRLERCEVLERLPSLSNLSLLQDLEILSCGLIAEIHGLEELGESLSSLKISGWHIVGSIPSLSKLAKLKKLSLDFFETDSHHLSSPELVLDLPHLQCMEDLSISGCEQLTEVNGIERLETLQLLRLHGCTSIRKLPDLSGLKNLRGLEIYGSTELTDVTGLENLESFRALTISGCTSLKKLPSVFKDVTFLNITGCTQLRDLTGLEKLVLLQFLGIIKCPLISNLPDLSGHKELYTLVTRGCTQLTEITGLERLDWLHVLKMDPRLNDKYRDFLEVIRNR